MPDLLARRAARGAALVAVLALAIPAAGHAAPDAVTAGAPDHCVTMATPCATVPVTIADNTGIGLRAYSVTVTLSANLSLCGAGFTTGSYLLAGSSPPPAFIVTARGNNVWVVDASTLGPAPCGATGGGTLFTLQVTSGDAGGHGTVSLGGLKLRDCNNATIASTAGPDAIVPIDPNAPPPIASLAAVQQKTGNPPGDRTRINVSWNPGDVPPGTTVQVWRKGFGNYPEYDDGASPGAAPIAPASPADANTNGWTLTGLSAPGADLPPARDVWYYVAFTADVCTGLSPPSNLTSGTLDYHLGDVSDGFTACQGDNAVTTADVSLLGAHYGATLAEPDPLACLDVGPTTDATTDGRPTTDDVLDFEDLMLFSLNYTPAVSAPAALAPAGAGGDALAIEAPEAVAGGGLFSAVLRLAGSGALQGVSAHLAWNPAVATPVSVAADGAIVADGGVAFSTGPGDVDVALLGRRVVGLAGDRTLATITFRALASGAPAITLARVEGRDARNRAVPVAAALGGAAPAITALAPAAPNPFRETVSLTMTLAQPGGVDLAIYDLSGRRVRTLARERYGPGVYRLEWDGRDERGIRVRPGLFYARLAANGDRFSRVLTLIP